MRREKIFYNKRIEEKVPFFYSALVIILGALLPLFIYISIRYIKNNKTLGLIQVLLVEINLLIIIVIINRVLSLSCYVYKDGVGFRHFLFGKRFVPFSDIANVAPVNEYYFTVLLKNGKKKTFENYRYANKSVMNYINERIERTKKPKDHSEVVECDSSEKVQNKEGCI